MKATGERCRIRVTGMFYLYWLAEIDYWIEDSDAEERGPWIKKYRYEMDRYGRYMKRIRSLYRKDSVGGMYGRMTLTKGGKHLVFCKEGSIGTTEPILSEAESYKVLWPIETEMLNKDPKLVQTPGYE